MSVTAVANRCDHGGERPWSVPRRHVQRDRDVPQPNLLAVGRDEVAHRLRPIRIARLDQIPVGLGKDDLRAELSLEKGSPSHVVPVRVADDHVANLFWIEPQLPQSSRDLCLDGVVVDRVDHDDPL